VGVGVAVGVGAGVSMGVGSSPPPHDTRNKVATSRPIARAGKRWILGRRALSGLGLRFTSSLLWGSLRTGESYCNAVTGQCKKGCSIAVARPAYTT
jgi:hypothetical protein